MYIHVGLCVGPPHERALAHLVDSRQQPLRFFLKISKEVPKLAKRFYVAVPQKLSPFYCLDGYGDPLSGGM